MVAGPNVVTPIAGPWHGSRPAEADTVVLPRVAEPADVPAPAPSLVGPLLRALGPALLLALVAGLVASPDTALLLGAAIGVAGAAVGLWKAFRAG
jgi:hypothetical protein